MFAIFLFVSFLSLSQAHAQELCKTELTELNVDIDAVCGLFHSQESYAEARDSEGSQSWQEGFVSKAILQLWPVRR